MKSEKSKQTEDQTEAAARFDLAVEGLDLNDLDLSQLDCEVRDRMIDLFKQRPKSWDQLAEGEQLDIAAALQSFGQDLVSAVVETVASRGIETLTAVQEKFDYKGGAAKITLKAVGGPELAQELAQFDSKAVLIVDADASQFFGTRKAATMPDAPSLFNEAEPEAEPLGEGIDLEEAAEPDQELADTTA